jgi:subtilase family serine protease
VNFTITNKSTAPSGNFTYKMVIRNNGAKVYDPPAAQMSLGPAESKKFGPVNVDLSSTNKIEASILADIGNLIKEKDEANNKAEFGCTVELLKVADIRVSVVAEKAWTNSVIPNGATITSQDWYAVRFSFSITNKGTAPAENFKYQAGITVNGAKHGDGWFKKISLAPGQSESWFQEMSSGVGVRKFEACLVADWDHWVKESDETNNTACVSFTSKVGQ